MSQHRPCSSSGKAIASNRPTRTPQSRMDPEIAPPAKKAVSRQLGEREAERERLQQAMSDLAERANDTAGRLAGAVRQALTEARKSPDAAATSAQMREFVERWVGPMVLQPDGTIAQKNRPQDLRPM